MSATDLYRINIKTDEKTGILFDVIKQKYEEKGKTLKIKIGDDMLDDFRFLKKKNIMVVDTIWNNNSHPILYKIYCFENDIEKAKEKLLKMMFSRIEYLKNESDKLQSMLKIFEEVK